MARHAPGVGGSLALANIRFVQGRLHDAASSDPRGMLELIVQKSAGAGLLGFQQVDAIQSGRPLFLFVVLFGLSMDSHVFLLSRIRERFLETGDNAEAVAHGLRSTVRLISGAALIMVAVFGGFALGEMVPLQQMGFGLAVAVLVDATIIRSVLVPAGMRLLGDWNWYLPNVPRRLSHLQLESVEPANSDSAPSLGIPASPCPLSRAPADRGRYPNGGADGCVGHFPRDTSPYQPRIGRGGWG